MTRDEDLLRLFEFQKNTLANVGCDRSILDKFDFLFSKFEKILLSALQKKKSRFLYPFFLVVPGNYISIQEQFLWCDFFVDDIFPLIKEEANTNMEREPYIITDISPIESSWEEIDSVQKEINQAKRISLSEYEFVALILQSKNIHDFVRVGVIGSRFLRWPYGAKKQEKCFLSFDNKMKAISMFCPEIMQTDDSVFFFSRKKRTLKK